MKRDIITIDNDKCTGCGQCVPGCPEGALQIIDGKVRLVSDLFCDGLGACIGECPENAIHIEKREAEPYDERKVMANIVKHGEHTVHAHLRHLKDHNECDYLNTAIEYLNEKKFRVPDEFITNKAEEPRLACGCPGSTAREIPRNHSEHDETQVSARSELTQWPVQLQLLNPDAPYFKNSDILIAADCVPFSFADFHRKFLKNKKLIIFCPKLDSNIEEYIEKLARIFKNQDIKSVTIAHMEVPCCFGINRIIGQAIEKSGKKINMKEFTISVQGEIIG